MERTLLANGLRNLLVVPLFYDRQTIGTLNLASPNVSDLTVLTDIALREVTPLFATALRRSREEMNNRMQAIIRRRYTAIHPAIEWRFRQAANRMIYDELRGLTPETEEIVFDGVYPLYSVSDLRGSSHQKRSAPIFRSSFGWRSRSCRPRPHLTRVPSSRICRSVSRAR